MDPARLRACWRGRKQFTLLETHFDSGLSFLAACHAWLSDDSAQRCERLHIVSLESRPANWMLAIEPPDLGNSPAARALDALAQQLAAQWPIAVRGVHRFEFAQGKLTLTLVFDTLDVSLAALWLRADVFHLNDPDALTPGHLDVTGLSKGIARLAGESALVVCPTPSAELRAGLEATGFVFDDLQGGTAPASAMEGRFAPKWRVRRYEPPMPERSIEVDRLAPPSIDEPKADRLARNRIAADAMIIGAGLAGCALAERLSMRGLDLVLLDAADVPARRASGNPAGVFHPVVSADDSLAARATRAGFLYALRQWAALEAQGFGFDWRADGLVQAATTPEEEASYRTAIATLGFPSELVQYVSTDDAYAILGVQPAFGGLYFPHGGMLDPASLCHAQLAAASSRTSVTRCFNCTAATLRYRDGLWHALGADGHRIASAPLAIVANAADASRLASLEHAPVSSIRGQLSWLDPSPIAMLRHPLIGDGYVLPNETHRGRQLIGASYELDDLDEQLRPDSQQDNLERLGRLVPAMAATLHTQSFDRPLAGRVAFRCVTSDRMPMIGQLADEDAAREDAARLRGAWPLDLPRQPGLYGAYAYGSRGLTWAALGAEIIASRIFGEPLPVTRDIGDAFDPARFLQRALRQRTLG